MTADGATTSDGFPVQHNGALFGKMMLAIRGSHSLGNRVRMLKLPLILTDSQLYAGAIANFYFLTRALELAMDQPQAKGHPVLSPVRALGLKLTEGYEKDLQQLYGEVCARGCFRVGVCGIQRGFCTGLFSGVYILFLLVIR